MTTIGQLNTEVRIAGVVFKNPVIAASGTFGFGKEYSHFYDISALGGLCTKAITLAPREGNGSPRIAETCGGMLNSVGLQNPGVDTFIEEYCPFLQEIDTVIIANVAGSTEDDYAETACRAAAQAAVDMIELNISCPNVKAGGMAFGIQPSSVEKITHKVRAVCAKPLIVKLSPNVANIADNAIAAEAGGADAVSLINTVSGMAIDYKTRRPVLANIIGGLSGPAVKPIALKMVYDCYRAVKIPVIGMGGIMCAADAFEFMLAGAAAVQVGSANIFDPMAAFLIQEEIRTLMQECGISSISELTGALKI